MSVFLEFYATDRQGVAHQHPTAMRFDHIKELETSPFISDPQKINLAITHPLVRTDKVIATLQEAEVACNEAMAVAAPTLAARGFIKLSRYEQGKTRDERLGSVRPTDIFSIISPCGIQGEEQTCNIIYSPDYPRRGENNTVSYGRDLQVHHTSTEVIEKMKAVGHVFIPLGKAPAAA